MPRFDYQLVKLLSICILFMLDNINILYEYSLKVWISCLKVRDYTYIMAA